MLNRTLSYVLMLLIIISVFSACGSHEEDINASSINESFTSENISFETSKNDSESIENNDSSINESQSKPSNEDDDVSTENSDEDKNSNDETSISDHESSEAPDESSKPDDSDVSDEPDEPDVKESKVLFDSSDLKDYSSPFLPSYAPFALYDTTLFSETVITSISFPFDSLASGYTVDSDNLYMPVYVIKSDFTDKKHDCTVENGKKIILDFTGKLSGVKRGEWITVDGLSITVASGETLAFGDTDMAVLPMFLRNDGTHGFWNKVFDSKGANNHSLILKIEGYHTSESIDNPNGDEKKYISFLGDSISTYSGWSNNTNYNSSIGGNAIWYPNNNYIGANLTVQDTWWHIVAEKLGYELAVNNSWSGSVVNTSQTYNVRAKNLHNTSNGAKPDVVVIFMGVNDYAAGTPVGDYDGTTTPPVNPTNFSEAYGRTIQNILDTYDGVKIYCCTFLPDRKRFPGSANNKGIEDNEYNAAIRTIAKHMGVKLIDLYNDSGIIPQNISQFTVDKLHPNKDGMKKIADTIIKAFK